MWKNGEHIRMNIKTKVESGAEERTQFSFKKEKQQHLDIFSNIKFQHFRVDDFSRYPLIVVSYDSRLQSS